MSGPGEDTEGTQGTEDRANDARAAAPFSRIRAGDRRTIARLMRDLDDNRPEAFDLLRALQASPAPSPVARAAGEVAPLSIGPSAGTVIGVTGGPGAGKSTLVDMLIAYWRAAGDRVGVVAVDPSSAFGGGAVLGDRIRMQRHATDPGVFIRSLASRGALGGLSRSAMNVAAVMIAGGFSRVLVETVGAGQAEVDIAAAADVTLVVLTPGLGDDVQTLKAGILEIADLLVLNKADHAGAESAVRDLQAMLSLRAVAAPAAAAASSRAEIAVPILRTVASTGEGVAAVAQAIDSMRAAAATGADVDRSRRRRRAAARILSIVSASTEAAARAALASGGVAAALVEDVAALRLDARAAADALMARLREGY